VKRIAAVAALALGIVAAAGADEPIIDHQSVPCNPPQGSPRICAYIADDGEIKQARVYFKTAAQKRYYWIEMRYDGNQFCATLPRPGKRLEDVDYYLWAVDDEYLTQRTTSNLMKIEDSCPYAVVDEDPLRAVSLEVHATAEQQGKKIKGFDRDSVARFIPAG